MKKVKFLYMAILISLFISCEQGNYYYEEVVEVNGLWEMNDAKTFTFSNKEKGENLTMYLIVRNDNEYPYNNIYFFTKLKAPNNQVIADTLEYQLAKPSGEWLGTGVGEVKQNTLVYKEALSLQDTGTYTLQIKQAMREQQLKGVQDISLMIEKN